MQVPSLFVLRNKDTVIGHGIHWADGSATVRTIIDDAYWDESIEPVNCTEIKLLQDLYRGADVFISYQSEF